MSSREPSILKSDELKPETKGLLLVVGAYFVTIIIAIIIIVLAIMLLSGSNSCSTMGRAMVTLWITIAVVFLVSVLVVRGVAWKITPKTPARWTMVIVHGLALLVSYVLITFGLLIAFNC
jgi:hypothetical protein